MKLLDGMVLYPEIELIDKTVDTLHTELTTTKSAIMELVELDDALKGEAGEAIRSFYNTVHIPFLTHLEETLLEYQENMQTTKDDFLSYDNAEDVYIHEDLLESEVVKGLDQALDITEGLVIEANDIMGNVSDIISLAPLSMDEFAEHVMTANDFIYNIVLNNLYDLDDARKSALLDISESFEDIHTFISSVGITFKDKATIKDFQPISAYMLPGYGQLFKKEEYFSDETREKVKLSKDVEECEGKKSYAGYSMVNGPVYTCQSDTEAMIDAAIMEVANPFFSGFRDGQRLFVGTDPDTGEKIGFGERAFSTLGLIPGVSAVKNAATIGSTIRTVNKVKKTTSNSNKTYNRPSGFRKGVKDEVWEKAKTKDGQVRDPLTNKILKKDEPWDMGHKPGYEFRKHRESAMERDISRKQFLDEHNNPDHYRPELPSSNRSHKGEDLTDDYFGY